MKLFRRRPVAQTSRILVVLAATCSWGGHASVQGAITLTADPAFPPFAEIATTNPWAFGTANHGFAGDRQLRQTFKNDAPFDIGEIVLNLDLSGTDGTVGGLVLNLYTVDDVNAPDWFAGNPLPIKSWTVPISQPIPATSQRIGIAFSGADVFNLLQRNDGPSAMAWRSPASME